MKKFPATVTRQLVYNGLPIVNELFPARKVQSYRARSEILYEPFPTIYWLASKELAAAVSVLESNSFISSFEERMRNDCDARAVLCKQHQAYTQERSDMLLTEAGKAVLKGNPWLPKGFVSRGIGGIQLSDPPSPDMFEHVGLKCLHLHYAHYLASNGNNIVGHWVARELGVQCKIEVDLNDLEWSLATLSEEGRR
jgi:hypothetical protein